MASRARGGRGDRHSQFRSWRRREVPETRHFSTVLNSEVLLLGKLSIPDSFVAKYGRDLSCPVLLKVNRKIWQVRLRELRGTLWLCTGWSKLMKKFSMREGYSLLFGYEGNSLFHVQVLDSTGMEIEYPSRSRAGRRSPSPEIEDSVIKVRNSTEEETSDNSDEPSESSASEVKADSKRKKKYHAASSSCENLTGHEGASGSGTSRGSRRAQEAADQFDAEHDSFQVAVDSSDTEVDGVGRSKEPKAAKTAPAVRPLGIAGMDEWDPYGSPSRD